MLLLEWQQTMHSADVPWFSNLSYFRGLLTLQVVPLNYRFALEQSQGC